MILIQINGVNMTKEQAMEAIAEVVRNKQGCKATELVCVELLLEVFEAFGIEIIYEAVKVGSIREVEYILPDMNYREKSFLLPAGTEIVVK